MINKVYSMIGIAEKAGKVVSGEFSTEKAIKSGKACLVILASDASENTRKHFSDMCAYRDIPISIYGSRDELGHAIGKEMRVNLAITDRGLADSIRKRIEEMGVEDAELEQTELKARDTSNKRSGCESTRAESEGYEQKAKRL